MMMMINSFSFYYIRWILRFEIFLVPTLKRSGSDCILLDVLNYISRTQTRETIFQFSFICNFCARFKIKTQPWYDWNLNFAWSAMWSFFFCFMSRERRKIFIEMILRLWFFHITSVRHQEIKKKIWNTTANSHVLSSLSPLTDVLG
mgnify:CR=1 FL=1